MNDHESAMEFAHIERVQTLIDLKRSEQALKETTKGLAHFPDSYYLHFFKALAHLQLDDFSQADHSVCQTIKLDLNNGNGYYLRSLILHRLLNFKGELDMAKEAARLDAENERFLGRLVEAHLQSGEYRNAKEVSQQLVRLNPGSAESHEQLARICLRTEDWAQAEQSLRDALAIQPSWTFYHQLLATTLRRQKRLNDAIEVLFIAVKLEPTNTALLEDLDSALQSLLPLPIRFTAHQKALESLPAHLAHFYRDRHARRSWYQKYTGLVNVAFWLGSLILISLVYTLISH